MRIDVRVELKGADPRNVAALLTAKDMRAVGNDIVATIRKRTLAGIDRRGNPFKGYSTRPIYVAVRGARLAPKPGRWSRSRRSVYYAGGYREYKLASRLPGQGAAIASAVQAGGAALSAIVGQLGTAEVDLTLSGRMLQSLHVSKATASTVEVSLGASEALYGVHVNEQRQFVGLTKDEATAAGEDIAAVIVSRLEST